MATELAVGYISLVPSARGITAGIQNELGAPLEQAARDSGRKTSGAFSGSFSSGANKLKGLLLGAIGAASVVQGVRSIATATNGLEDSEALLANSLKATHQAATAFDGILGPLLKKNQQWGNSNADVNDSLATLVRAGASAKTAVHDEALAANLAAARHISLASATSIVSKVLTGHVALLGRYGIQTKDSTGKTISQAAALKLLGDRFGGAASANAATFGGKMRALHAQLTNVEATIGQKVIPILVKLGSGIAAVVDWFSKGSAGAHALEVVIAASLAGFVAYKAAVLAQAAATAVATAAQQLLGTATEETDAAMAANPVGLLVAALVGLGVVIFEVYKHFGPFHAAIDAAWQIIQATFHWIVGHWPLLLAILTGPIGAAVIVITKNWSTIKNGFTAVKDWIGARVTDVVHFITGIPGRIASTASHMWDGMRSAITSAKNWVGSELDKVVSFFKGLPGKIATRVGGMFDGIKNAFRSAINAIIDIWNGLQFKVPGFSVFRHHVGGFTLGLPNLPHVAHGGVFNQPTLAVIGESPVTTPEIASPVKLMAETFRSELQRAGAGRTINAPLIVHGSVFGVDDLDAWADRRDRQLAQKLAAGAAA